MTIGGRLLARIVKYTAYFVLVAAALTFLMSYDIRPVFWFGVLFALAAVDLAVHYGEGDLPISELSQNGTVNLAATVNGAAEGVIERAADRSVLGRKGFYLILARRLVELPEIADGLRRLDVKPDEFRAKLDALIAEAPPAHDDFSARMAALAPAAFAAAVGAGHDFIKPADLFSGLTKVDDEALERLFALFNVEEGDLERALIFSALARRNGWFGHLPQVLGGFVPEGRRVVRHRIMNRAWTSRPTPALDKYGTDLTDLARNRAAGFMVGHDAEYERLVETIARPMNPNAMLIGEAGIGKEAIVRHLAFSLVKDDVPAGLFDRRLVMLQLQNLAAGAPPAEIEARLKTIVEEIETAGNVILYIPDIHNLVRTSGTAYLSAADALMPVIMANEFPIIGSTYPKEFKQLVEPRSDFVGAFETIPVTEISEADAEKVLTYESFLLEREAKVTVSFGAIKRAVVLAKKYFYGKFLPSSAEELLKSAIVDAERRGERMVTPERVTAVAEEKVNVPMHEAEGDEAAKLLNMEALIHERLIGQEEAVKAVARALREYRSGLARKGGPIASFLFVGPTGVGKTELAKALATIQFGSEKMMIRFDMTEYQDKESFSRFIGSPDGSTRGALTDAVMEHPYALILFDEFEKAFPDILNLFLQVLDDGRLTDNLGRTVDFTNTIIIATSNAHSDILNDALAKGESVAAVAEYLKAKLTDVFKPELLNRFSKVVVFRDLAPQDLVKIVVINLQELVAAVKVRGIMLSFSDEAIARIAKLGYDPQFGARPLRRVIDEYVRAPLAEALLAKKVAKGERVTCTVKGEEFDFVQT